MGEPWYGSTAILRVCVQSWKFPGFSVELKCCADPAARICALSPALPPLGRDGEMAGQGARCCPPVNSTHLEPGLLAELSAKPLGPSMLTNTLKVAHLVHIPGTPHPWLEAGSRGSLFEGQSVGVNGKG